MEFQKVDLTNITEEELLEIIKKNVITARDYRASIAELKQIQQSVPSKTTYAELTPPIFAPEKVKPTINQEFEDDVEYYLLELKEAKTKEDIISKLKDENNPNYINLLLRLKTEYLIRKQEFSRYFVTEDESSGLDIFKDELDELNLKIDTIEGLLNMEEEVMYQPDATTTENNLIFVPTPTGYPRVIDELESIPSEYYQEFASLFQSIKNGTFKNFKRINRQSYATRGVSEVRGDGIRVLFDRVGPNSYALISAFTKKVTSSRSHTELISLRIAQYKSVENEIKENIGNEDFMSLHEDYEKELFRMLGQDEKTISVVKEKGGQYE